MNAHVGRGEIARVAGILDAQEARSVFLVCGRQSFEASGAESALREALAGRHCTRFSEFDPNPDLAALERGLAAYAARPHDVILAVGGGTALDLAKLVAAFAGQPESIEAVLDGSATLEPSAPPLIAVPTTAGTGSEATHFAVLYVGTRKHSVAHPRMRPTHAIVDPELTYSVTPSVTASTGLDALAQAMESAWSVHSTEASVAWAREAIDLAFAALPDAVARPSAEARYDLCRASHLAGKAIDITKTTAPHALSYAMTAHFGVPHGHAVSLTLGEILAFNAQVTARDTTDPRGADHVRRAVREIAGQLGCADAEAARGRITALVASLGLAVRLGDLGIRTDADRALLGDDVNVERLRNNPRALRPGDIHELFERIA